MGIRESYPRGEAAEAWNSALTISSSAEIKIKQSYISILKPSWRW